MRPEAPFRRPVAMCSCITVLIRFRGSLEKPACSGAAVGKLAPSTSDATKEKTQSIRMSANLPQRKAVRPDQGAKLAKPRVLCGHCVRSKSDSCKRGGDSLANDAVGRPRFELLQILQPIRCGSSSYGFNDVLDVLGDGRFRRADSGR